MGRGGGGGGRSGGGGAATAEAPNVVGNQEVVAGHDVYQWDPDLVDDVMMGALSVDPDVAEAVAKRLGVDQLDASQMVLSVNSYTGSAYTNIRKYERGEHDGSKGIKERAEAINKFLDRAPKYGGEALRGLSWKTEAERDGYLNSIVNGLRSNTMDSWSSSRDIAYGFASSASKPYGVVLRTQNRSGSSIKQLSRYDTEYEVLVRKGTNYRVTNVTRSQDGKLVVVDVDDMGG